MPDTVAAGGAVTLTCDGCAVALTLDDLHCVTAEGHEAHFCVECHDAYTAWVTVCQAEEARLNRLLDLFIASTREHLALGFVPQDLPRRLVPRQAVVLQ